ncbi:MAG: Hydrogenase expression/formation regulatory protein [Candidatus Moranbacteria bacterium GW2011_GWF2_36_839]|nr:MAG: Hydrogenase expression/formation regulatory protein [Candidatus Moranbacteria bacterium GW2011_GWF1_36_78]KKQ16498.1 MAG: Hydrogenase expression/formation regulatory protein [Candidatus Moranbacteria bacterium GW2011_GWF2_36_839]HAT74072.1 hypothetical protein [Candidatus Moranbacteria bacterium]HBY10719.1 hypothetical protein [Candidatus Moranbacteria bacterium]
MKTLNPSFKNNIAILALGAESAGNFSVFRDGRIFSSDDFGDLLEEKNWIKYQASVLKYLKNNKIKPQIILTDLHPLYKTTLWGEKLAKKSSARFVQVQHHHAHIFSAVGDKILHNTSYLLPPAFYCIAMDGTGFGVDEKIWGGEAFKVESRKNKVESVKRIGHLENQVMISGDLAVREPARMLIGVLSKLLSNKEIYPFIKKYYTKNQFELIYNQLGQNFNCLETSSTGRVLDAVSILLGFCGNERKYKHEPIDLLEKNSTLPYSDLKPKITISEDKYILDTTHLFNYVISAIGGSASGGKYPSSLDKHRIAATAQLYIANGFYKIIKLSCRPERSPYSDEVEGSTKYYNQPNYNADSSTSLRGVYPARSGAQNDIFIAGGIANNKIISDYLISKGAYANTKIPRGDAGLSFGQIICYLLGK